MPHEALKKLHTSLVDTIAGYKEATRDADTAQLKSVFADVEAMHARHHLELHDALKQNNIAVDDEGSFMTKVHEAVIAARAAITGLEPALAAFASGEERIINEYDEAIKAETGSQIEGLLERQKSSVLAKWMQLKAMAKDDH